MNTPSGDPRPLVGEPLPLDLLNTRWSDDAGDHDLFELPGGLAIWLKSAGLSVDSADSDDALEALSATREALLALVQPDVVEPGQARELLNDTLRRGRVLNLLGPNGPERVVETDTPGWRPAWLAANGYLDLLVNPSRIRKCANPACPLRFYDVSKSGARRWCSMSACGNRSKARSHYARHHGR